MRGSTRGSSPTGSRILVLDSGAIFAGTPLRALEKAVTTPSIVEEVRDPDSRKILEMLEASGRLEIIDPPPPLLERVKRVASRLGVEGRLSKADLGVAALALHYKGRGLEVVVATDDYTLQLLLDRLGIPWVRVRYRGVRR